MLREINAHATLFIEPNAAHAIRPSSRTRPASLRSAACSSRTPKAGSEPFPTREWRESRRATVMALSPRGSKSESSTGSPLSIRGATHPPPQRRGQILVQIARVKPSASRVRTPCEHQKYAALGPRVTGVYHLDKTNSGSSGLSAKPSDGLEPSTPSLPSRCSCGGAKPSAADSACFRRFRVLSVCGELRWAATALLHNCSTTAPR